jgi:hypothetical protein
MRIVIIIIRISKCALIRMGLKADESDGVVPKYFHKEFNSMKKLVALYPCERVLHSKTEIPLPIFRSPPC